MSVGEEEAGYDYWDSFCVLVVEIWVVRCGGNSGRGGCGKVADRDCYFTPRNPLPARPLAREIHRHAQQSLPFIYFATNFTAYPSSLAISACSHQSNGNVTRKEVLNSFESPWIETLEHGHSDLQTTREWGKGITLCHLKVCVSDTYENQQPEPSLPPYSTHALHYSTLG